MIIITNINAAVSAAQIWGFVWPIVIAILSFLFLIFIHELGHFLAAKAMGVRVNEFAIGFGPTLFRIKGKETVYSFRAFPLGGYCAMEGEEEDSSDERAFCNKKPWRRLIVIVAGAFFNILFGFLIVLLMVGMSPDQYFLSTTVGGFYENSVSESSGLENGDRIVEVNGRKVNIVMDLYYTFTNVPKDGEMDFVVIRNGEKKTLDDVRFATQEFEGVNMITIDFYVNRIEKGFGTYITTAAKTAISYTKIIWWSLIDLVTGKYGISSMSGPVGVAAAMSDAVKRGLADFLPLIGLITINLGIMNLLPLPAVDGGKTFFILIEMIRRKPVPQKYEAIIHGVGLVILLAFIVLITFKDIWTLISG